MGINFRMFEHLPDGRVGVIVKKSEDTDENASRLAKAGYRFNSSGKRNNINLYTIDVDVLIDKHKKMMELIKLEAARLAVNGVTEYRYDFTSDQKFSISVLDEHEDNNLSRNLTEIGYNFSGSFQKNMSEFSIPLTDLEEIHNVSLAEISE